MIRETPAGTELWVRTDDGARLSVSDLPPLGDPGSGHAPPTVLLAHGWASHRRVWGVVADRLVRSGHRVILYDQRGHGSSSAGREPITVPRLAKDLGVVLDTVGAEDVFACGHSGGGFALLAQSARTPRFAGLVLVATAAQGLDASEKEARMLGGAPFSRALAIPWLGRRMLSHTLGKSADSRVLEVHRQMFAGTDPQVRTASFACAVDMDLLPGLADLRVPTLVITGTEDRVIAPSNSEVLARAVPGSSLERLPGVGHMVPLEAPDRVVVGIQSLTAWT